MQQKIHCVQAKDKRKRKASHLTDKRSDEGLTLKTSTFLLFTVDNFSTFSTQLLTLNLAIISAQSESYLREKQVGALKSKDNVEPFYNIHLLERVELKLHQC